MAKKRVDIDTKQIKAMRLKLKGKHQVLAQRVTTAANEVLFNVEEQAKALAPRDGGRLEQSINSTPAHYNNGKISGKVGSNLVYALRRHEEAPRMGTYHKYEDGVRHEGYYYNGRGELTRAKPNIGGFKPGRKYLENSSLLNEKNWKNNINDAIHDTYKEL